MRPFDQLTVEQARAMMCRFSGSSSQAVGAITSRSIPGPAGDIPVRIYTPEGEGPFPLLMSFHGGGFVLGDLGTNDDLARALCVTGCVVVSVGFRLAPEHKFPAAPEDCEAATIWAVQHATELRADPSRVAVSGESSGGNLAAVTARRLRDRGGPRLAGQLLLYPVTDYYDPGTPSYRENATGYLLTRDTMIWFWNHYLNNESDADNPSASPLRAGSLNGLPPALIVTAELDPVRDDGEWYARRLAAAGVRTRLSRYDGVFHGFLAARAIFKEGRAAYAEVGAWLADLFHLPARA